MAGRKTKWRDDFPDRVEEMARKGMIEVDMQKNLGVGHTVFSEWKNEKTEFADALKRGKVVVDDNVESKLLTRAMGFMFDEEKIETACAADGTELKVFKKTVTKKYILPDTTAQIFWLKNRRPDEWRDKSHLEHGGKIETELTPQDDGRRVRALVEEALSEAGGNGKNGKGVSKDIPE